MSIDQDAWLKAYKRDTQFPDGVASGWIQWKGTDVCVDLYCECGFHGHYDGEFFYHWRCPDCDARYNVGQNIKLIRLTKEEISSISDDPLDDQWKIGHTRREE